MKVEKEEKEEKAEKEEKDEKEENAEKVEKEKKEEAHRQPKNARQPWCFIATHTHTYLNLCMYMAIFNINVIKCSGAVHTSI